MAEPLAYKRLLKLSKKHMREADEILENLSGTSNSRQLLDIKDLVRSVHAQNNALYSQNQAIIQLLEEQKFEIDYIKGLKGG
jgi:hypothetical protein